MALNIPEDFIQRGGFWAPHFLLRPGIGLDKNERLFLLTLIAIEDEFLADKEFGTRDFFATNKLVHERSGLSVRAIPLVRQRLQLKGAIAFKRGHTGRATEYRILIEPFYRGYKEC